jgi:hypothetical protein
MLPPRMSCLSSLVSFTPALFPLLPILATSFHARQDASSSPYGPISITNCLLTAYAFAIRPILWFPPPSPPPPL